MDISSMKVAGIDTGKMELTVCILPGEFRRAFRNDGNGIAALASFCREHGVLRAGIEATSIYHRKAMAALAAEGIAVAELQPRQMKGFAQALLHWSKSDPLDAYVIARLTQVIDKTRPVRGEALEKRAETLTFIELVEDRIVVLKTSIDRYSQPALKAGLERDIKALEKRKKRLIGRLEKELRADPAEARRLDLLLSIPGLGTRTALALLIRMPELGYLERQEVASLAGVAPFPHDSGAIKGERHIYGGRSRLRKSAFACAFTAAMHWNKELNIFYKRLAAKGKAHTLIVVACTRKLLILANAILQRGTPWQDREVMP